MFYPPLFRYSFVFVFFFSFNTTKITRGFPGYSLVKNLPANTGDTGLIPGSGRSPGEENGNPLQYSCLGNPMDRGAWRATVHGVTKSWTWLKRLSTHAKRQSPFLFPLNLDWPYDLFWPMYCNRTHNMSVLSLGLKRPWVFLPEKFHRQRSLVIYIPGGFKRVGPDSD